MAGVSVRVHPVDADPVNIAGGDAPTKNLSSPAAFGHHLRPRDHVVDDTITQVHSRTLQGKSVEDQNTDKAVDIFIKAKLKEWDQDQSGCFNRAEVAQAMEELRETLDNLARLKWQVISCSLALAMALLLGLGSAALAYSLAKTTSVSNSGSLQSRTSRESLVTTVSSSVGDLPTVLSFDVSTDEWNIDDSGLRNLDQVSFTTANGTFYHFKVAELRRFDSGPQGSTDQLDIVTEGGHQLRFIEISDGFQELEVKWKGAAQWVTIDTSTSATRRMEADGAQFMDDDEDDDVPPHPAGAVEPPPRLLSKGHYVGGVFVHSRGGHYTCDPDFIDGYHNPELYCDSANPCCCRLWLCVLFLAHWLGCTHWS